MQKEKISAILISVLVFISISLYFTEIFAIIPSLHIVIVQPPIQVSTELQLASNERTECDIWKELLANETLRKEQVYQLEIERREYMIRQFKQLHIWYYFPPLWRCESEERIGYPIGLYPGDGHKWVCTEVISKESDCLIYSIGLNGEVSFDEQVRLRWPNCEIHGFDTDDTSKPKLDAAGVIFHKEYVLDLKDTQAKYNHTNRWIDILKVDIEGTEWTLIPTALSQGIKFKQLQLELHHPKPENMSAFFHTLENYHYRVFHQVFLKLVLF